MLDALSRLLLRLQIRAMQRPVFWSVRRWFQLSSFRIARRRYVATAGMASLRRSVGIGWQLIRSTGTIAVAAIATAIVLQLLDIPLSLPAWMSNPATYDSYLQTTSAIAGVVLALSFSAIGTLASGLFGRLPNTLRSFLLYEEVTSLAIQSLTFITVLSFTALGLRSLGLPQSRLVSLALILAMPVAFASLIVAARRVFNLFDPSVLAAVPLRQLLRSAAATRIGEHRAGDPSFQQHHHRLAATALDTVDTMIQVVAKEGSVRGDSLLSLTTNALNALGAYLVIKRDIPTSSLWFLQKPRYFRFFAASGTQVDLASMTESSLSPALEADYSWVERRVFDMARSAFEEMRQDPAARRRELILQISQVLQAVGAEWDLSLAREFVECISNATTRALADARASSLDDLIKEQGLADAVTGLPAAVFLGFSNSIADSDFTALSKHIEKMDWRSAVGTRSLRPRLRLRRELERVRATTAFELKAEGRTVTPGRVHVSQAIQEIASELRVGIGQAVDWFSKGAPRTALSMKALSPQLGAIACINSLAFRWKLERNLERLRSTPQVLDQIIGRTTEPWTWDTWFAALTSTRSRLEQELATALPELAAAAHHAELPDLLGEAVHRIGEGCADALAHDRAEAFIILFPHYFNGVLLVAKSLNEQEGLSAEERGWRIQDALLDLISLSGNARIYSSLHRDRRYVSVCRSLWIPYLRDPRAPGRCEALNQMIESARVRITPRSSNRMRWQMVLERALRELPREDRRLSGALIADSIPRHPSRLIRFLGRNDLYHFDGAKVFRDVYLRREPACVGVALRRDNLATAFRHFAGMRQR